MGVSASHPLEMKKLRHMAQRFERESFALIGEYLIVYRHLLYRIAVLVGSVEKDDQLTARDVEAMVEKRPAELLQSLRRCCDGKQINQRGDTLDTRALRDALTALVDVRHMIAHAEFEHGPSWAAEIGEGKPWWQGKSTKHGDKRLTYDTIQLALQTMKKLGRPLAKVAELNGLRVPAELDGRPLTDHERGVVNQRIHMLHCGMAVAPAEGLESAIITDGIKSYDDLAQPLNEFAALLGISPDGSDV